MKKAITTEQIEAIKMKVEEIMHLLKIECNENTNDTPERVARMFVTELFKNVEDDTTELDVEMTTFENPNMNDADNKDTPIILKGIKFFSMCEHHLMPFWGYVDVEYVPDEVVIGLSKIPRVVKWFSKRPQIQERFTKEIGEYLVDALNPKYLKVTVRDVHHTCVEARGIESECQADTFYKYKR
jgi:GTP cyclohydrolase I